jgi:hypothetical protein
MTAAADEPEWVSASGITTGNRHLLPSPPPPCRCWFSLGPALRASRCHLAQFRSYHRPPSSFIGAAATPPFERPRQPTPRRHACARTAQMARPRRRRPVKPMRTVGADTETACDRQPSLYHWCCPWSWPSSSVGLGADVIRSTRGTSRSIGAPIPRVGNVTCPLASQILGLAPPADARAPHGS